MAKGARTPITPKRLEKFLEELSKHANVSKAAEAVNLSRPPLYNLRKKDPEFAAAWAAAHEVGIENLIDKLNVHASDGYFEDTYELREVKRGRKTQEEMVLVSRKKKFAPNLLMFKIKKERPEYRDTPRTEDPVQPLRLNVTFGPEPSEDE